jgi:hypothetical protein
MNIKQKMLVLFYGHYSRFSLFFKWDFNALEYIQFACGCFIEKNINVYLFYKHSNVSTSINMDIVCFKLSF